MGGGEAGQGGVRRGPPEAPLAPVTGPRVSAQSRVAGAGGAGGPIAGRGGLGLGYTGIVLLI